MRKITEKMIKDYELYLRNEERSNATIEKYSRDLLAFLLFLPRDKHFSKESVICYKEYLTAHYAPASVNSMLAALNGFLSFMEWTECKVKPLKIQRKVFCPKEKELTKQEYLRLIEAAKSRKNQRLCLVMETICSTGIRVSELCFITVEAVKCGRVDVYCKGKARTIFLPAKLCNKLKEYFREKGIEKGTVFVTKNGKPLNRSNIWHDMKALCEQAKVEPSKVFPHNLRHLFARTYYRIEKDLSRLADLLGHSNIETTRIYTVSTGVEHARQINGLELVD